MGVNSTHPDYNANAAAWLRARVVVAGEDAVKAAGDKYLPGLDAQSPEEYRAYKTRASFFNAAARGDRILLLDRMGKPQAEPEFLRSKTGEGASDWISADRASRDSLALMVVTAGDVGPCAAAFRERPARTQRATSNARAFMFPPWEYRRMSGQSDATPGRASLRASVTNPNPA